MQRAVCPGSFDPVTNGHLDIVSRASVLFDEVTVAVLVNQSKQGMFSVEERVDMLSVVAGDYGNVRVGAFEGLLVDFCRANAITVIVKGLRAISDFDYELQMAQMNRRLAGIETVFLPTSPEYSFLAARLVKEVATHGGDVSSLVPAHVLGRLLERVGMR